MTPAPEPPPTLLTTGDWLPGYEVLATIGTGGFGKAVDRMLEDASAKLPR